MPNNGLMRSLLKTYQGLEVEEFSNVLLLEFSSKEKELQYIKDSVTAARAVTNIRHSALSILILASLVFAQSNITVGSAIAYAFQVILCLSVYVLTYFLRRATVLENFGRLVSLAIGLLLLTPILQQGLSSRYRSTEKEVMEAYDIDVNFSFLYFATLILVPVTIRNCIQLSTTFVLGYIFVTLSLFPSESIGLKFLLSVSASAAYSINGILSMYWLELERRQTWLFNSRITPKLKSKYFVPSTEYPPNTSVKQFFRNAYYKVTNRKRLVKEVRPEFHRFTVETVRDRFPFLVSTYIVITIMNLLRHYMLTLKGTRDGIMIGLGASVFLVGLAGWIGNRRWETTFPCFVAFSLFSVLFAFASTYEIIILDGHISFYNFLFPLFDVAITAYIPPHTSLLMYWIVAICSIFFSLACTNFQLLNRELVIPLMGGLPALLICWLPLFGASILRKELLQELYHARKVSGELSNDEVALKEVKLDFVTAFRSSVLDLLHQPENVMDKGKTASHSIEK
ncbi:hypothetical protein BKA69DRAFT_1178585 [Paraphysoderma sedebokerense]|nr:hypothetical protein BKA69DRAFT_1178585 [Paraphysoderma sedebokerense]